ncbi:NADPH-dependent 1-acyldihydroxyacetone phosphate reductase [Penicillium rolfsii]|nr:NADPH-dependent 1-acyldihydroxyacetone phosphate reductase [Penicillium rolfsii]
MGQKTVLITGCSEGGIGDALAKTFHKKGLKVFATARNTAKVQHLKSMGLEIIELDVTDEESIRKAVSSVKAATGGSLDILVNNSGAGYSMPLLDTDVSVAQKIFNVNVFAVVAVTQAFAPLLIASKGTIINIGSVLGKMPLPWQGYYNASKAAVAIITDQMRLEFSSWGVRAILVTTGAIKTNFFNNLSSAPHLPENSLYYPAKDVIEPALAGTEVEPNAMDVNSYAEVVVNNALRSSPKKHLWSGGGALIAWLASTFGWSTVWDTLLPSVAHLPEITKKIRAAEKAEQHRKKGINCRSLRRFI